MVTAPRRHISWRGAPTWLLAALLLSGCGQMGRASAPTDASALFSEHCAACHSFGAHGATVQEDGNLQRLNLSGAEIRQLVAEMPQIHGPLDRHQIAVLTRYLLDAEKR